MRLLYCGSARKTAHINAVRRAIWDDRLVDSKPSGCVYIGFTSAKATPAGFVVSVKVRVTI